MRRIMLKSKLHNAIITQTELQYMGSITIDPVLLEKADILPYERVQVVNINNGARLETYAIEGERGSGGICMNGPSARLCEAGDRIHIISYTTLSTEEIEKYSPVVLILNEKNEIIKKM